MQTMSHNIRSRTYMQVAARERAHRAQIMQVALALLVLLMILFWNQLGKASDRGAASQLEQQGKMQIVEPTAVNAWSGL